MKKMISGFTVFEKCYVIFGLLINYVIAYVTKTSIVSVICSTCSVFNAILMAKGSVVSYIFALIETTTYIIVSFGQHYYSEVIVNVFGLLPLTIYGLISWLKNQNKKTNTVSIKTLSRKEVVLVILSQVVMSFGYYQLLKYFNNEMLVISTINLAFTILGVYFASRMSIFTFVIYIVNCVFKSILWIAPIMKGDFSNTTVLIATLLYLVSDTYGLINWTRLKKVQEA